jgi:hypothetical protein
MSALGQKRNRPRLRSMSAVRFNAEIGGRADTSVQCQEQTFIAAESDRKRRCCSGRQDRASSAPLRGSMNIAVPVAAVTLMIGEFADAVVLKRFGDVPEDLSEL